jgi:tetratricopeptide (TPR) repeat protein
MQRRQLLRRLGGFALAVIPAKLFGDRVPAPNEESAPGLSELLEEANDAYREDNLGKAHELYLKAFNRLPEVQSIEMRAEIIEAHYDVEKQWKAREEELAQLRADAANDPQNTIFRKGLAQALTDTNRNEEAIAEFQRALDLTPKDDPRSNSDRMDSIIWIGICHHRQGRHQEALNWLEKVQPWKVDGVECSNPPDSCIERFGYGQESGYWQALRQRLLIYSDLKRVQEAEAAVLEHVRHVGRLHEPYSRALAKIGIDSDRIYVEHAAPKGI